MFRATLAMITKRWKQPTCPSIDEKKIICTMEYYSVMKRNEELIPAIAWMNLENITCFQNMKRYQACKAWFLLYDISRIGKSIDLGKPIEIESRLWVTRDGGRGEWGVTALWVQGGIFYGVMKCFETRENWCLHNFVNKMPLNCIL